MFQSEICDLNGIFNRKISVQSQKLVIRKTSLNQFIPVGVHLSEIGDLKKAMVLQNDKFLPFLTKLTVNTTRLKISA